MNETGLIAVTEPLSESRRAALLTLLTDEDPAVYHNIRQKILSFGPDACDWLRPHMLSRDPALRRRVIEILKRFDRQAADDQFLGFCLNHGEDLELEQGAWLLARTQYPEINVAGYQALLDSYAEDLQERLGGETGARKVLGIVNHYLFAELGYTGNAADYYDPENSYLNRVLDRRTGNPINLCLLYLLLGRRLQLPVTGIGLPGHFICRHQSSSAEYFIDVFNGGKLLNKADCVHYLLQGNYNVRDDYLAPVSPRLLLLRICSNLHQIYVHLEETEAITRFQRYLVALGK